MRKLKCLLTICLAFSLSPAHAQSQNSVLAANETLLQLHADASVFTPAQTIALSAILNTTGATSTEARAENAALFDKVIAALKKVGGDPNRVRIVGPARAMGFIGSESYRDVGEAISAFQANGAEVSVGTPKANVSNLIEIKFSDAALIDKIRDAVESTGAKPLGAPVFSLNDESATKRQARAVAIAKVRADAAAYAEALGLRVVRLLRVSDFSAGADAAGGYVEMMRQMNGVGSVPSGQVETMALVWADFALGPK